MGENIIDTLVDSTANPFREQSPKVGAVYTLDYSRALVAVYDFDREQAGGLPKGAFLVAAQPEGDEGFILLRILKEARLPNAATNDQTRQQAVETTANERPWPDALDEWMKNQLSIHGIECRILGTFLHEDGVYRFAEDIDNYYAVNNLFVWKPDIQTLNLIVNYQHRSNPITLSKARKRVGEIRFAAAEKKTLLRADMLLDPTDLLQRRTVYLGMSRSGKSNAMKITAEGIYRLREEDRDYRIGQLIFDPNGEYAQDNPQDGPGLHRIHEAIERERKDEVETYGLFAPPSDPHRRITKLNFFGDPFPNQWTTASVENALDQLIAGRDIIRETMSSESARYTTAFRDADLSVPQNIEDDFGGQTRYRRAILAYQTALAAAGFTPPQWDPSINNLFNKSIIAAMHPDQNNGSNNQSAYEQASIRLNNLRSGKMKTTWPVLTEVFTALNQFISDKKSGYDAFETDYVGTSRSGENWADALLKNILRIFETQNGPRSFLQAQEQHDPDAPSDFAQSVVDDLRQGKLVIIDQSIGDPEQIRKAAERIMWKVFRTQQEAFRTAAAAGGLGPNEGHVLVYIEEAHNLLPRAASADNLRTVWARAAKEGSKMNLGMVMATQAPSSIMSEILSETDNWILAYLNSENERKVIAGYMDFGDFLEQIGQVSEPGFVRMRTLSQAYTVPVQFDRFHLDLPER